MPAERLTRGKRLALVVIAAGIFFLVAFGVYRRRWEAIAVAVVLVAQLLLFAFLAWSRRKSVDGPGDGQQPPPDRRTEGR